MKRLLLVTLISTLSPLSLYPLTSNSWNQQKLMSAQSLLNSGKIEESLRLLRMVEIENRGIQEDPLFFLTRGKVSALLGNKKLAVADFQRLSELLEKKGDHPSPQVYETLCSYYLEKGQKDSFKKTFIEWLNQSENPGNSAQIQLFGKSQKKNIWGEGLSYLKPLTKSFAPIQLQWEIQNHYEKGEYQIAIEKFNGARDENFLPTLKSREFLVKSHLKLKEFDSALKEIELTEDFSKPENPLIEFLKLSLLFREKRWDQLALNLNYLKENQNKLPKELQGETRKIIAFSYLQEGKWADALENWKILKTDHLEQHDEASRFYNFLGELEDARQSPGKASEAVEKLTLLAQTVPQPWAGRAAFRLAQWHFSQENPQEAHGWMNQIPMDDKNWSARHYYLYGRIQQSLSNFSGALETFQKVLLNFPDSDLHIEVQSQIGACYEDGGNLSGALEHITHASNRWPDNFTLQIKKASLESRVGKERDSENTLLKIFEEGQFPLSGRKLALEQLLEQKFPGNSQPDQKISFLKKLQTNPISGEIASIYLGTVFLNLKKYDQAIFEVKKILGNSEESPYKPNLEVLLARAYLGKGEFKKASFHFDAWNKTPTVTDPAGVAIDFYQVLNRLEEPEKAHTLLKEVCEKFQGSQSYEQAMFKLGQSYLKRGEKGNAETQFLEIYHYNGDLKNEAYKELKRIYAAK